VQAQYNLGMTYVTGQGSFKDNVYAHMWWSIAAASGDKDAVKNRDIMAKRMTAADISESQGLARACVVNMFKDC
jgi:TPR repeat protein